MPIIKTTGKKKKNIKQERHPPEIKVRVTLSCPREECQKLMTKNDKMLGVLTCPNCKNKFRLSHTGYGFEIANAK